jgi:uncharacterized protein (TIGR02996 family)
MTEHDAFLQAIIESPDDDTLRLVFADWLEEHGDAARAELIQLQCSLNSHRVLAAGLARDAVVRR